MNQISKVHIQAELSSWAIQLDQQTHLSFITKTSLKNALIRSFSNKALRPLITEGSLNHAKAIFSECLEKQKTVKISGMSALQMVTQSLFYGIVKMKSPTIEGNPSLSDASNISQWFGMLYQDTEKVPIGLDLIPFMDTPAIKSMVDAIACNSSKAWLFHETLSPKQLQFFKSILSQGFKPFNHWILRTKIALYFVEVDLVHLDVVFQYLSGSKEYVYRPEQFLENIKFWLEIFNIFLSKEVYKKSNYHHFIDQAEQQITSGYIHSKQALTDLELYRVKIS